MSSLPSDLPKLPKWPFLVFDALLLSTAAFVACESDVPLSGTALVAVVGCVALAAIVCVIPFLTDYARSQEYALDERQRALEALSKSVANSAEQLGIAAQGVSVLGEHLQKTVKQAEQLPQKIHEKLGELQQNIAVVRNEEIEDLEKEVSALRAAEGERLEAASEKVLRALSELSRVEGLIGQLQLQAKEQSARLTHEASTAAGLISKAAREASDEAAARLERQLGVSQSAIADTLGAGKAELDEDLDRRHQELHTAFERLSADFAARMEQVLSQVSGMLDQSRQLAEEARRLSTPAPVLVPVATPAPQLPPAVEAPAASSVPQPEEPAPAVVEPLLDPVLESPPSAPEPVPAPVVPAVLAVAPVVEVAPAVIEPEAAPIQAVEAEAKQAKPASRKSAKKPVSEPEAPSLDLFSTNYNFEEAMLSHEQSPVSASLSSDGATRLLVTSYIGIGNKLFIRGVGEGLSMESGQPLEFVSIGKWRWQSNDLNAPARIRLYKNDRIECPGLGEITLEPGHQTEVTAKF